MIKRLFIFLAACFFLQCNTTDPIGPSETLVVPEPSLHGTWGMIGTNDWVPRISFDTLTHYYIEQWNYGYNFYREFDGGFVVDSGRIGFIRSLQDTQFVFYKFQHDTLFTCEYENYSNAMRYTLASPNPTLVGWSTPLAWTRRTRLSAIQPWILGFAVSDSGIFITKYSDDGSGLKGSLYRLDSSYSIIRQIPIDNFRGIEANGRFLWTLSSSHVVRRNVADLSSIDSIGLSSTIEPWYPGFAAMGIATDGNWVYVSGYYDWPIGPTTYGLVCRLIDGLFNDDRKTDSAIKDLALVEGRIFCVDGGTESFFRLSLDYSGNADEVFHIAGAKYTAKICGIAYYKQKFYLCSSEAQGVFIYEVPYVP